jgi:hypothetical protein
MEIEFSCWQKTLMTEATASVEAKQKEQQTAKAGSLLAQRVKQARKEMEEGKARAAAKIKQELWRQRQELEKQTLFAENDKVRASVLVEAKATVEMKQKAEQKAREESLLAKRVKQAKIEMEEGKARAAAKIKAELERSREELERNAMFAAEERERK